MEKFFILTGRAFPLFIEDEDGEPYAFESMEAAEELAEEHTTCQAYGFVVVVWDEGYVDVKD